MKKYFCLLVSSLIGLSSCSSEDEFTLSENFDNKKELYADYAFSIETPTEELERLLADSDSISVPMTAEYLTGTLPLTKADVNQIIPYQGTIVKLENKKTLWKENVGENLVPSVFCGVSWGDMTISELWQITLTVDLTNEDYAVRGFVGEWSGWSSQVVNNPQTRYQGTFGDVNQPKFTTYVWRIVSDISGRNWGYTRCYVPFDDQNKARIYVRIYQ